MNMITLYALKVIIYLLIAIILLGYYLIFKKYKWSKILVWLAAFEFIASLLSLYFLTKSEYKLWGIDLILLFFSSSLNVILVIASSYLDFGIDIIKQIRKPKWLISITSIILALTLLAFVLPENKWIAKYPDIFLSIVCLVIFTISMFLAFWERKFYFLSYTFLVIALLSITYQFTFLIDKNDINIFWNILLSSSTIILSLYFIVIPIIWLHKEVEEFDTRKYPISEQNDILCENQILIVTEDQKIVICKGTNIKLSPQAFFDLLIFIKYKSLDKYNACININDREIDIDHKRIYRLKKVFKDHGISENIISKGPKVGYYYLLISKNKIDVNPIWEKFLR